MTPGMSPLPGLGIKSDEYWLDKLVKMVEEKREMNRRRLSAEEYNAIVAASEELK